MKKYKTRSAHIKNNPIFIKKKAPVFEFSVRYTYSFLEGIGQLVCHINYITVYASSHRAYSSKIYATYPIINKNILYS